jgi:2-oxoglutarate ferredoxin oxidoreductase subunit gamma
MPTIQQIRWSGFGGQGVVLAGVLLGQAGVIEGKNVSTSNSYGVAARGAACKSEIIFSEGPIDFPHLITADIFVAMSQGAYKTYCHDVRPESGIIIYDPGLVNPREDLKIKQVGIPATEITVRKLKEKQAANIVLLGALAEITGIVSQQALRKALPLHIGKQLQALNLKALSLGRQLGRRIHG